MKQILTAAFLSFAALSASCQNPQSSHTAQNKGGQIERTIPVSEFEKKLAGSGVQLIDVRTPEEYAEGHLKGAVNMNVNDDGFDAQVAKLDKTKPVLLYCRSGKRSANASGKMHDLGFTEIYNLDGGIIGWGSAGKPIEKAN